MDVDTRGTTAPRRARQGGGCLGAIFNLGTGLMLLLTLLACALVTVIYQYPDMLRFVPGGSAYIPATQAVIAQVIALPTLGTPQPIGTDANGDPVFPTLPAEWTATMTPTITQTPLPRTASPEPTETQPRVTRTATVTLTPTPTATATAVPSTNTPSGPTPTATNTRSPQAYTLQPGSPTYLANFLNRSACNWFGFAGRVFALDDSVIIGLVIKVRAGDTDLPTVQTGSSPAVGTGGYEVKLADHPIATTDVYTIQLFNNTGTALSERYTIPTFGDCTRNVVLIHFVQNH